ncbi:MAG: YihY/virulence factor BrkB family protein [Oceanicaulis sp.]
MAGTLSRYFSAAKSAAGDAGEDNLSFIAGGVAFFGFLAIFPALSAAIMVWGLFADPADVQDRLAQLGQAMPEAAWGAIEGQMSAIAGGEASTLGIGLLVSLLLAFWSAAKGARALIAAMNISYAESDDRGFIANNLVALAFTVGGIFYAILTIVLVGALPALLAALQLGDFVEAAIQAGRWLVAIGLFVLALAALYRWAPDREGEDRKKTVLPGAVAATLLWVIASAGFSIYTANFANYNATFGALASVVVLMLWLWISAFIVCLGAVLNAELEPGART